MPNPDSTSSVLITGATSPIAAAYAALCAKRGQTILLAGRDAGSVEAIAQDLRIRHQAVVRVLGFDAARPGAGAALAQEAYALGARQAVAFHGMMGASAQLAQMMQVNCLSVAELFEAFVALADGKGEALTLVAISSVAGDRGRQSNYPYGTTKAALNTYLAGLRNRVYPLGHRVITIKPGFVRTRMTAGKVSPTSPLLAEPAKVAADVDCAMLRSADVVYTPWFWRGIMFIIRAIPEAVFKRLRL